MVVRPFLWPVFLEYYCKNDVGPQRQPIEGISIITLTVMAFSLDVSAAAPMVDVSRKPPILTMRVREFGHFLSIDSYVSST